MKKIYRKSLATALLIQMTFPDWANAMTNENDENLNFAKNEIIIQYKKEYLDTENLNSIANLKENLSDSNKVIKDIIPEENIVVIEQKENHFEKILSKMNGINEEDKVKNLIKLYEMDPSIEIAQPNFIYKSTLEIPEQKEPENNLNNSETPNKNIVNEENSNSEISNEGQNGTTEEQPTTVNNEDISALTNTEGANDTEAQNQENPNPETNTEINPETRNEENTEEITTEQNQEETNSETQNQEETTEENNQQNTEDTVSTEEKQKIFNDPLYKKQWYLENNGDGITGMTKYYKDNFNIDVDVIPSVADVDIDYEEALEYYKLARERLTEEQKNKKTKVAVIDSGVNYTLSEFEGKMWDGTNCVTWTGAELDGCVHGYNFYIDRPVGISILSNHGTNVSSIISANSNNEKGMVGIAPDSEIMALNVSDLLGRSTTIDHIRAIYFAELNGANLVNLSIGGNPQDINDINTFDKLLYYKIMTFDGVVVNAGGNEKTHIDELDKVEFPAVFARRFEVDGTTFEPLDNFIVVGAINSSGEKSSFSNYGKETIHLMAPGSDIIVTGNDSNNTELADTDYDMTNGTSFSAPIVTASLAFMKSAYPEKSYKELAKIMLENVDVVPEYAELVKTSGRLNLAKAMKALEEQYQDGIPLEGKITIQNNEEWTNNPVTISLETNKAIKTPENWEKIDEKNFSKSFDKNIKSSIVIETEKGQTATINFEIKNIDTTAPVIKAKNNETIKTSAKKISIGFDIADKQSGTKTIECKHNEYFWANCNSPYIFELDENKNQTIKIRATDNAGNTSEETIINIEKIEPKEGTKAEEILIINSPSYIPPTKNNSSGSSGGAGGYIQITNENNKNTANQLLTPSINPKINTENNEENIVLSSAPETKTQNISNSQKDDVYIVYENNFDTMTFEDFEKILKKKWIKKEPNSSLYNFSITEKIKFFENYLSHLEKSSEKIEANMELKNFSEKTSSKKIIFSLYENFINDWKSGKFFILK